jgi:hypothetical protein
MAVIGVAASAGGFALADESRGDANPQTTPPESIQQVPAGIAAAFPALRRALDPSEARQLPAVAQVMSMLASQGGSNAGTANSGLARRISQAGEDAEYLVPGNEVLCIVSITAGRATGGGCAPAPSVEAEGTTSLTVLPGGYELTGILPRGATDASITNALGDTATVAANENRAVHFFSPVPLVRLVCDLPAGGRHVGSLALPPPPHVPPPAG